jgi:hypothetical protein
MDSAMKYSRFCIGYTARSDSCFGSRTGTTVVDADGSIPSFKDLRTLGQFAETNGIALESETPVLHDLD